MNDINLSRSVMNPDGIQYELTYSDKYLDRSKTAPEDSHIHNCTEIYLNICGDVSFLVKNAVYPVEHGDLIITRASELHHCVYHASCVHEHFCLWIDECTGDFLSFLTTAEKHHLRFSKQEQEELISYFRSAYRATLKNDAMAASTYIMHILLMIRDRYALPFTKIEEALPPDFQQILDYINENYGQITNTHHITENFFISSSTLNRRFIKHLHMSPKEYLESVKLSNAKRMLDEGKSVTSVCFNCGYSDSSHFIRNFKKKFHMTPHKYKVKGKGASN